MRIQSDCREANFIKKSDDLRDIWTRHLQSVWDPVEDFFFERYGILHLCDLHTAKKNKKKTQFKNIFI